jgi:hypothetical protein
MDTRKDLAKTRVEIYAVFMNIDKSISLLNPIIESRGYRFIEITLNALEAYYSEAFYINKVATHDSVKKSSDLFKDVGINVISRLFKKLLIRQFGELQFDTWSDLEVDDSPPDTTLWFLKRIRDVDYIEERGMTEFGPYKAPLNTEDISIAVRDTINFASELTTKLRLCGTGQVGLMKVFAIGFDDRNLYDIIDVHHYVEGVKYRINKYSINAMSELLEDAKYMPEFMKIQMPYFELYYNEQNPSIRIILLFSLLEGILLFNGEPIKKTIIRRITTVLKDARLSDLCSDLYKLRCEIAHPTDLKKSLEDFKIRKSLSDLEFVTRKVLNKIVEIQLLENNLGSELTKKKFISYIDQSTV